jgi:hypothetical protein
MGNVKTPPGYSVKQSTTLILQKFQKRHGKFYALIPRTMFMPAHGNSSPCPVKQTDRWKKALHNSQSGIAKTAQHGNQYRLRWLLSWHLMLKANVFSANTNGFRILALIRENTITKCNRIPGEASKSLKSIRGGA